MFDLELVQISWISKCALCRSRSGWWLKMPGNKSVHVVLHGHCHRAWHLCSRRCELGRSKSEWKLLVNLNARACLQRFFSFSVFPSFSFPSPLNNVLSRDYSTEKEQLGAFSWRDPASWELASRHLASVPELAIEIKSASSWPVFPGLFPEMCPVLTIIDWHAWWRLWQSRLQKSCQHYLLRGSRNLWCGLALY